MISQLLAAATAGKLSLETFLDILKRGNVLPDDVDVETEKERIMLDGGMGGDDPPPDPNAPPAKKDGSTPPAGSGSSDNPAPNDKTPTPPPVAHPPVDLAPVMAAIAALQTKDAPAAVDLSAITSAIAQLRVELTAIASTPDRIQVVALPVPTAAAPQPIDTPAPHPLAWEITKDADGKITAKAVDVTTPGGQ